MSNFSLSHRFKKLRNLKLIYERSSYASKDNITKSL